MNCEISQSCSELQWIPTLCSKKNSKGIHFNIFCVFFIPWLRKVLDTATSPFTDSLLPNSASHFPELMFSSGFYLFTCHRVRRAQEGLSLAFSHSLLSTCQCCLVPAQQNAVWPILSRCFFRLLVSFVALQTVTKMWVGSKHHFPFLIWIFYSPWNSQWDIGNKSAVLLKK